MAKIFELSQQEKDFLKELAKNEVPFMIVGLSAAILQGAPLVTQDIDLWLKQLPSKKLEKVLKKFGGSYIPPMFLNPPIIIGEGLNLFDLVINMHGLGTFGQEVKYAKEIKLGKYKVKVLPLERIIKSKEAANREKDRIVLPVLRDALAKPKKKPKNKKKK